jgi:hypothetical protein
VLAAAACGGSQRSSAGAECRRQAAILRQAPAPHDLSTAADVLETVIGTDRSVERELGRDPNVVARAHQAAARAAATLSDIRQTDQRALMTPLRTGVPGARRALADVRGLLRVACP